MSDKGDSVNDGVGSTLTINSDGFVTLGGGCRGSNCKRRNTPPVLKIKDIVRSTIYDYNIER